VTGDGLEPSPYPAGVAEFALPIELPDHQERCPFWLAIPLPSGNLGEHQCAIFPGYLQRSHVLIIAHSFYRSRSFDRFLTFPFTLPLPHSSNQRLRAATPLYLSLFRHITHPIPTALARQGAHRRVSATPLKKTLTHPRASATLRALDSVNGIKRGIPTS